MSSSNRSVSVKHRDIESIFKLNFILKVPITEYPTTYLIGTNGKALAVLAGSLGQDELVQKLDETVKSFKEASAASTSAEAEATSSNKPNLDDRVAQ